MNIEHYEIPSSIVKLVTENTAHHRAASEALDYYEEKGCLPDWFLDDFYAGFLVVREGEAVGDGDPQPLLF